MVDCLIGLGCNQGDCASAFERALQQLSQVPSTQTVAVSHFIKTRPVGTGEASHRFLNAAVLLQTDCPATLLLDQLQQIESRLGRPPAETPRPAGSSRPIDLDLLLYELATIDQPRLKVPHPRMSFRRFVLEPGASIAPSMFHPTCHLSLSGLLEHLDRHPNWVTLLSGDQVVAERVVTLAIEQLASMGIVVTSPARTRLTPEDGWVLRAVASSADIPRETKLLVFDAHDRNRVEQYRGPRLELDFSDPRAASTHVLAAVEAMLPLDPSWPPP